MPQPQVVPGTGAPADDRADVRCKESFNVKAMFCTFGHRKIGLNGMLTPARAAKNGRTKKPARSFGDHQQDLALNLGRSLLTTWGRAIHFLSQAPHIQSQIDLMESQGRRRRNQGQHHASASGAIGSWSCWRGLRKG
ncbi:hypothetical protein D4764_0154790 [Takifugu flavidus]|uniref:Uncharacterized protein n=1 Tax=Takifugu flavidus TaxID=433684 RepID=A0A5C6MGQ2_9TELE|nr:hypothetical protein D4764_0170150 [Takifugu flavidus]TWW54403.1 hypothetical protein D4764_0154790 [Takifugu flavidus]